MRAYRQGIFARAAKHVYKHKGFKASMLQDAPVRAAIEESYDILRSSLEHISHDTPKAVRSALDDNTYIFSGFRTYHSLRELGLALTTDEGHIRSWGDFKERVLEVHQKYNVNYLEAEYDHAVGSALMADRWLEQERSGGRYNLQYRTAGDSRVRPDHEALEGITLPKSDPFWLSYYPPNGWRCRCSVVEVLPEDYPVSESEKASALGERTLRGNKQEVFRGNPGKDLRIFPDKHPYYGSKGIAHCGIAQHAKGDKDVEGDACKVVREIEQARKAQKKIELTIEQKAYRKTLQEKAWERYRDSYLSSNGIQIKITHKGIKEYLNQPHVHYFAKNELIRRLPQVLKEAKYLGAVPYHKSNPNIVRSHLFELTINGDKTWIIAREDLAGEITFYSITDDPSILDYLKKK